MICLCPKCGQLLYHRAGARDRQFGSPMRPCPNCGAEYYDPRWQEPALCKNPKLPLLPGTVWGGLLLGIAFLLGAFYLSRKLELSILGLLFLFGSIWYAVDYRRSLPQQKQTLQLELEESRKRLKNPAYRQKLAENGVKLNGFRAQ